MFNVMISLHLKFHLNFNLLSINIYDGLQLNILCQDLSQQNLKM